MGLIKQNANLIIRIFVTACALVSAFALIRFAPFSEVYTSTTLFLIVIIAAGLFFVNESFGMVFMGLLILLAAPAGQPAVMAIAAAATLLSLGNPRFICGLAALVPLFVMNLQGESWIVSIGLAYLIFFICVFFNGRLANKSWKYGFPIYFSALAYNFGLYTPLIENFGGGKWTEKTMAGEDFNLFNGFVETFNKSLENLGPTHWTELIIIVIVNVVICAVAFLIADQKGIKFLSLPLHARDGIVFGAMAVMMIVGMVCITRSCAFTQPVNYLAILIQAAVAFAVTRPFADFEICKTLGAGRGLHDEGASRGAFGLKACSENAAEDVKAIIETYMSKTRFEDILGADKNPVNCILLCGRNELDKGLVAKAILADTKIETVYTSGEELFDEYDDEGKIALLEEPEHKKMKIIVVENVTDLISVEDMDDSDGIILLSYLNERLAEYAGDRSHLFIFTADNPADLPDGLFSEKAISRVVFCRPDDSVLLNRTYRLHRQIGKGGGGLVYNGYHERLGAPIVVKKIINNSGDKRTYKAEANVLKNLKHTYLPKVYDVFEEDGEFYTVMDFISGSDLSVELVRNLKIDQGEVLRWSRQLAEVVGYLHRQNPPIIHSDIKPGNVMLTPDGNIALIDFNISLLIEKNLKSIGATPGYSPIEQYGSIERYYGVLQNSINNAETETVGGSTVSPEEISECTTLLTPETTVLLGEKFERAGDGAQNISRYAEAGLSEKSDIYSIGATMYSLLTGIKPPTDFTAIRPIEEVNPDVSPELCRVIEKAMELDPARRFASTEELTRALEEIRL